MTITVHPVIGLPLIRPGDDLPGLIAARIDLFDGDILCIASSVWSKAKGYLRRLDEITPSERAQAIAGRTGEDPRFIQAVLDESEELLLEYPFVLSVLPHGHIGVRAGVDQSNVDGGQVILLPPDPMGAAGELRASLEALSGARIGVIVTDTCGRAFRRGQTGHAIGWSGLTAIRDFRGDTDLFGHTLQITEEAVVDECAGFANLVMGESNNGVPAVVIRGLPAWTGHDDLYWHEGEDLIREALCARYPLEPLR
ncbi:MAG TPA: coenzyme F420-0:L-glutamate ligase [Methanoregulaceae archaeon]|nr:coenzyme F420-0:L-glutamate ligase [Methanoregulaceae archaeon]HQJ87556.1 coenzyme F420-0:L-glutamate ligase [Methanoregulaceae archaeon]